jgi:hypothetical protein
VEAGHFTSASASTPYPDGRIRRVGVRAALRVVVMRHGFAPPLAEIPWLPAFGTSA